ncbi:MAG: hypothetical protein JO292_04470 [Betaproteobacteria bacterium]|nr:hypothetical protein [Betaproteobacteria bacterium]MBV9360624.1 hypothetical protein [Betaproteobacteria bacterium]
MRVFLLLPIITLAACATAPKDLENMSTAEVCHVGLTERGMGPVAGAEIQRREEDCGNHVAELAQMADYEKRVRPGIKGPLSVAPKTSAY